MSYYGAGDYYGAGGIFSSIGKVIGGAARIGVGVLTGGVGGGIGAAASLVPRSNLSAPTAPQIQIPQLNVNPRAILPGGAPFISVGRRRRRMNFANGKALGRANRRVDGFVRLAKKSLKHTQYRIVTKGSGRGKKSGNTFIETGPGGIRA